MQGTVLMTLPMRMALGTFSMGDGSREGLKSPCSTSPEPSSSATSSKPCSAQRTVVRPDPDRARFPGRGVGLDAGAAGVAHGIQASTALDRMLGADIPLQTYPHPLQYLRRQNHFSD